MRTSALGRPHDKVPPWLLKWAALVLGFVQQERRLLPAQLLALRLPLVHYTPLTAAAEAKGETQPVGLLLWVCCCADMSSLCTHGDAHQSEPYASQPGCWLCACPSCTAPLPPLLLMPRVLPCSRVGQAGGSCARQSFFGLLCKCRSLGSIPASQGHGAAQWCSTRPWSAPQVL